MKMFSRAILLIAWMLIPAFQLASYAQEKVIKQDRKVDVFFQLLISGQYDVVLQQGEKYGLVLEGPASAMDAIHAEVKTGTLMVYTTRQLDPELRIKAVITYVELRKMKLAGSLDVSSLNTMKVPSLQLDVSGSSVVKLPVETTELAVQASGGALLKLEGKASNLALDMSGTARLKAYPLHVNTANVLMGGAARAEVLVKEQLTANLGGTSRLVWDGEAQVIQNLTEKAKMLKRAEDTAEKQEE